MADPAQDYTEEPTIECDHKAKVLVTVPTTEPDVSCEMAQTIEFIDRCPFCKKVL